MQAKLGDRRYVADVWQEDNGKWGVVVHVKKYTTEGFGRRVGWRWIGHTDDAFPLFDTRKDAENAGKEAVTRREVPA